MSTEPFKCPSGPALVLRNALRNSLSPCPPDGAMKDTVCARQTRRDDPVCRNFNGPSAGGGWAPMIPCVSRRLCWRGPSSAPERRIEINANLFWRREHLIDAAVGAGVANLNACLAALPRRSQSWRRRRVPRRTRFGLSQTPRGQFDLGAPCSTRSCQCGATSFQCPRA